jgi:hypothetical protein
LGTPTRTVNSYFLDRLGSAVREHSSLDSKPLLIDLKPPLPERLRVYAYSLVGGMGTVRSTEYKIVLRVPGQEPKTYGSFEHSGGRVVIVLGVQLDLDIFVMWDSSLHSRFMYAGNLQARSRTVYSALSNGLAVQRRDLTSGASEAVFACRGEALLRALELRVQFTGSIWESEWATLLSLT